MTDRSFAIRTCAPVLVGLPGVVALPFLADLPPGLPPLAVMANPAILLILMALAGAWAAPKLGLRSGLVLGSRIGGRGLAFWVGGGLVAGLAVALLDHALAPLWAVEGVASLREGRTAEMVVLGVIYGGMVEEVIFRWGLLALVALGLLRVLPRRAALWGAAAVAALAFALAHLPAMAMGVEAVTLPLILRTLLWNAALSLIYGAALLRQGLEAAMLAHAATHLGFALAAL